MKKISLLVLMLISIFVFVGCKKPGTLENVPAIDKEDIFNQKEDEYFIYFQRLDCEDCETANPYVSLYATTRKEKKSCNNKRPVYTVVLYTQSEKPKDENIIYREYTGIGGQGTDGKFYVDGVTKWQELYIASTASLIAIHTKSDGTRYATYCAQGSNNVVNYLFDQLGECTAG